MPGNCRLSEDLPKSVIRPFQLNCTIHYNIDMTSTKYILSSNNGDGQHVHIYIDVECGTNTS